MHPHRRPCGIFLRGCGSGILALAALRLSGRLRAMGVDVNAGAVECAAANARLNALESRLTASGGRGGRRGSNDADDVEHEDLRDGGLCLDCASEYA